MGIGVLPLAGIEDNLAIFPSSQGLVRQGPHLHEPLVAEVGLHHGIAAVAVTHGVIDFFLLLEQPCSLQICNHHLTGFLAAHATVLLRAVVVQAAVGIQDVDDFQIMTLGHLPVVGVVGGGNLYHTSSEGPVNVGVCHHGDAAAGEGQDDTFADELLVAGILRVDCHGSVSQKGFRTGGGYFDAAATGKDTAVPPV